MSPTCSCVRAAALLLVLLSLALPGSAFGQASRTWLSGVGDDANPCSRTAPCKTLQGAFSKTAAGGEINAIDNGAFGPLTITKAMTISFRETFGGITAPGTNGIVVNAGASDRVVLRGIDLNGLGSGVSGVKILAAKSVKIYDSEIYGFTRSAVDVQSATTRVLVKDSSLTGSGVGVLNAPPVGGISQVTLRHNDIIDNVCGVVAASLGVTNDFTQRCNASATVNNAAASGTSKIAMFGNTVASNTDTGVFAANSNKATIRMANNEITDNGIGLRTDVISGTSTTAGRILSWGNNYVDGNSTSEGAPTGTIAPM